jgi:divinyl chlorophyllide a 8-vinyl-reductase
MSHRLVALLLLSWIPSSRGFTAPVRRTTFSPLHHSSSSLAAQKTAVIAGATGYIGQSVVRESVRQGYKTVALVRNAKKAADNDFFKGAEIVECDVTDAQALQQTMAQLGPIEAIVSCLASRSGVKKDAYLIDYQSTLNCLQAGQALNARHFVLLSAFCVKNPWLQFQQAKLKFEAALQEQQDMTWTIVRPTAFFKSVSGQLEVLQGGAPYVAFGDGEVTRCNPIAESDLATYLMDSITDKSRENKIVDLGGPDEPLTMNKMGSMLFQATGKEPKFFYAPLWIFDAIINSLQFLADITKSEALENAAETGRIGKYYAVEDMLTTDPAEKYGTVRRKEKLLATYTTWVRYHCFSHTLLYARAQQKITLQEHYNRIAVEGQEYDPYTSMFAKIRLGQIPDMSEEGIAKEKAKAASR